MTVIGPSDFVISPSSCGIEPEWTRLFPEADFRLSMGLQPGYSAEFWGDWDEGGRIAAQRAHWLAVAPELYAGCVPEGEAAREDARAWMRGFSQRAEPDWVVLSAEEGAEPRVLAGEVVFPSGWSLAEKLGLGMSGVHEPVPGLNAQMGGGIQTYLSRLESGRGWMRENWGLAADEELNHHPARALPKLTSGARLEGTWIRLEHQYLTRLSVSGCVLFGIRVTCHRLDEVAALPGMRGRLHRALRTMPEAVARYKGLGEAREVLVAALG